MTILEDLKAEYLRRAEQLSYIARYVYSMRACREFSEVSTFYRQCTKKKEQLSMMAERGLAAVHAVTPPTEARALRYRRMIRFEVAFYLLWCEWYAVRYDGYLCAPPRQSNHEGLPFRLHDTSGGLYDAKVLEAIDRPEAVDAEISRFRALLREGFRTYGEKNLRDSEARLGLLRRGLPYSL
ncbi:MAG: hypothetical protein J6T24_07445 [Clostridia bacterium]|nr:hypothetical protein [Clostridia bacterium]